MMDYNPPLSRAIKIPQKPTEAGYRVTDGNIAAIDFGTTSVSLAYTTKGDDEVSTFVLDSETRSMRVANALLLRRDESQKLFVAGFGGDARVKFGSMRASGLADYIYFERIKMLIKREKKLDRQTQAKSFSGEKFYLVEVIAFILKYLKDLLIDHLSRTAKPLKTTDFDWVITVPAIWDARGKRMMREAAYIAGLMTKSGGITQFTPISGPPLPLPDETNSNKLTLALEPESAALYSQNMHKNAASDDSHPTEYMVIDIGGGTVDITAHLLVNGEVVVENIPTGNSWGGTQVNKALSKMFEKIVNDSGFKRFLASGDRSQQMAVLNKIFYSEFENQKVSFGQGKIEEIAISLPKKFVKFFEEELRSGMSSLAGIEYDEDMNDTLYIEKEVVESQLFGPALDGIIKCTLEAIEENEYKVNTFYLVGGFGGCKYVHEKVSAAIKRVYSSKGRKANVVVPPSPHIAVATGAAMWRKNPGKVKARRSDATYGIGTTLLFDPQKHDEHYKRYDTDRGHHRCENVFDVFLEKGELARVDEHITIDLAPYSQSDTQVSITIYVTPSLGVQYIKDKNGTSTVTKIGQLVLDVPNPDNLPVEQRIIDVTMDFSGTEIQAKAKYRVTGKEVKTVCDFLSTQ